jgi:hypothetical protein
MIFKDRRSWFIFVREKEYRLRCVHKVLRLAIFMAISAGLFAAEITGTVTNGTTGKPAAGAEVTLLTLTGAMDEVGKTRTDGAGHFSINVPDPGERHLVRVNHQSVNYFQPAGPGAGNVDITIYDSARQVAGIFENARVYRLQTKQGQLEVSATYTLRNESSPPRTQMGDETYEVEIPPRAQLVDAIAAGPGGMPVATSPVPTGKQNHYALVFPIRPGQTQFTVNYKMPYTGSYEFNITPDSQLSELGVLLPKSMKFDGLSRTFSQDSDEGGLAVFFAKDVPAHELVRFSVTGEGIAPREAQGGGVAPGLDAPENNTPAQAAVAASGNSLMWVVSAVLVLAVAGGGFWLWRRSSASTAGGAGAKAAKIPAKNMPARNPRGAASSGKATAPQEDFLEALKDELFQLERDRAEGKLSQEQYEKAKSGLEALIRRQLKKSGQQKG